MPNSLGDDDTQRVVYVATRYEYHEPPRDWRLFGFVITGLVILTVLCGGSALGALLTW